MTSARRPLLFCSLLGLLLLPLLGAQAIPARAQAQKPLRCAVDGSPRGLAPKTLCEQLGQALGRAMPLIADARKETKNDAVQIMHDDVQWTVVLLHRGAVRSWTRVSAADARGREALFFARALRSLLAAEPKAPAPCVRLEPKHPTGGAFDLVYPWEALKPCERRLVEVVDPWWGAG